MTEIQYDKNRILFGNFFKINTYSQFKKRFFIQILSIYAFWFQKLLSQKKNVVLSLA